MHKYDYNLAKLRWNFYLQGDRPGKLLAWRVNQMQARSKIPFMLSTTREKIYDPQAIANLFADYYQELYNLENSPSVPPVVPATIDSFLSQLSLPKLSQQQLDTMNAPITLQEVLKTFQSSKLLKAPGPDGLPDEYYQTFSTILAPYFQTTCNSIITDKSPPAEMLRATLSTIPKPGKSLENPANFRPISLLNSNIKLFSKIIVKIKRCTSRFGLFRPSGACTGQTD